MTLDLYSYGRSLGDVPGRAPEPVTFLYVCGGCGCSATATDPELIHTLGWRVLQGRCDTPDDCEGQRAMCPRCSRRYVAAL
jgi:hypothetical protein